MVLCFEPPSAKTFIYFDEAPATRSAELTALGATMAATIAQPRRSNWRRSIRRTDSLQLLITNLNSLAIIATFLAAVQAQVIGFSWDKNDTHLQKACNALFFAGLFVDILSGTIAIVGAVQLQRIYGLLQQRDASLTGFNDTAKRLSNSQDSLALMHHLRFLEVVVFHPLSSPRLWKALLQPLNQSADLVKQMIEESEVEEALQIAFAYSLSDYRDATNRLAASRFRTSLGFAADLTVSSLVIAGLACLIAGALCFALYSQPVGVWATAFGVLGSTMLMVLLVAAFIMGLTPVR
ncbi:hypothetical protein B0H19DRAFT_1192100 [Mycena capillaripes]|nr:hypothetical protein B0H19DRAFT_1192100 [Mycena capillaripes]